MLALSVGGSLVGLVPAIALGRLVDALAHGGSRTTGAAWAAAIGAAIVIEAGAYAISDGLYARAASRLYRDLRISMFDGMLLRRLEGSAAGTFAARFVSDAVALENLTVGMLDQGTVALAELAFGLVALLMLGGWTAGVVVLTLVAATAGVRRLQRPAAAAGEERQEALESMIHALAKPDVHDDITRRRDFRRSLDDVAQRELRLAWITAANRQGTLAIAGLGPVVALVAAALYSNAGAGSLLTIYLLAGKAFGAAETLFDLALEVEVSSGAAARCFALAG